MTESLSKEEDPEKRARMAKEIVKVMAILSPHNKDANDYRRKLWDHLNRISDYTLEVETPFPLPPKPTGQFKPMEKDYRRKYKTERSKQYGRNIEVMIQKACSMEEGEEKVTFVKQIANIMKMFLQNYAQTTLSDEVIFQHLFEMSNGVLSLTSADVALKSTSYGRPGLSNASSPEKYPARRGHTHTHTNAATNRRTDGRTDTRTDGRTDGRGEGRTDGRIGNGMNRHNRPGGYGANTNNRKPGGR